MHRPMFEAQYYETYYYTNVLFNILKNQFDYLRNLDGFYGDDNILTFIEPFPRRSALHRFIKYLIEWTIDEEPAEIKLDSRQEEFERISNNTSSILNHELDIFPINYGLSNYKIDHNSFTSWLNERGVNFVEATEDDVINYYGELMDEGVVETLLEKVTHEVFFVAFQNRQLLKLFNEMMANGILAFRDTNVDETIKDHLIIRSSGAKLKRVNIPRWVEKAVFFRDRGHCTICQRDLSGTLNLSNQCHYDHIVPLKRGGLNDVSNIQLLCSVCNLTKGGDDNLTSHFYEDWYHLEE